MMPHTIDDNGSHPGTPTKAKRGLIMPGTRGLSAPYWGWQIIGRQTPDVEEAAAFEALRTIYTPELFAAWREAQMLRAQSIEYRGVVSDSFGTIVWESGWLPFAEHNQLSEDTRGVAVHHNVWGCMEPGCENAHPGQEHWDA